MITTPVSAAAPATAPVEASTNRKSLAQNKWFQRLVVWGGLLGVYQIAAMRAGDFFLPTLDECAVGYVDVVRDGGLGLLFASYRQMLAGFGLAVVVGVPLGLLIGASAIFRAAFGWIVDALFVTSLVAVLPFIILLTGTDFSFRVTVVFLFCSFYMILNPAAGVRSVDPELREMARSFSAGRLRTMWTVTAPSVLPFILAGMRLALAQGVQGMVVAELWISVGTGKQLRALGGSRQLGEFFALASMVVVVGVLFSVAFLKLQHRVTPWSPQPEVVQ